MDNTSLSYSRELIFFNNGQYDAFVELTFVPGSEAYNKFGPVLLGTFYYTKDERNEMEASIKANPVKDTSGYVKFTPSDIPKELTVEQKVDLDKKGILNTDIDVIRSRNIPRTNRYTTEGERKIQNQIVVEFDSSGISNDQMKVGYLRMRVRNDSPLIKEEWEQYVGLEQYHNPGFLAQISAAGKVPNKLNEGEVRYNFLSTKFVHSELSGDEMKEFEALQDAKSKNAFDLLLEEIKKSHENVRDFFAKYKDKISLILRTTLFFDTEVVLPYKFPIWWNLERFLHIYLRHVKEVNAGDRFVGKSLFRYSFEDVKRIVTGVLKEVYEDIEKHFADGNSSNFRRQGKRAVYFDGVYYKFEINPQGLIIVFHPEENIEGEA